jgi:tetratricopeptide (TPR) repeat protein
MVYLPALSAPFLFDDLSLPFIVPGYEKVPLAGWLNLMRPMVTLSFWMNFQIHGTDPFGYHAVNLLLHFANGILVGFIAHRLLTLRGVTAAQPLAWFAGAWFVFHPLQTEAVTYVASRSENLTVFFFYAAFAWYLYHRGTGISWGNSAIVLVLFGLACLSKEYSVVLPGLLILCDLFFADPAWSLASLKRQWRMYLPVALGAVGGAAFVWTVLSRANTAGFSMKDLTWSDYFFTQCRSIWVYAAKWILPVSQNVDYDFPISRGLLDHGAFLGLIGLWAGVAGALLLRSRFPLAAFGFLTFLLLLAPTSSFVPIRDVLVERRVYLASIGLILIALEFLSRIRWNHARLAGLVLVVIVYGVATAKRNQVWASPLSLWQDTALKSPHKPRPHFQLAFAHYSDGNFAAAAAEYEKVAQLETPDYRLLIDWGLALDGLGQLNEALAKFQAAAQRENTAQAQALIGMMQAKQGRYSEALAALDAAEKINGAFEMTYVYRGNVYLAQNQLTQAAEQYQKTLSLNPNNASAREGLRIASQNRR